MHVKDFDLHYLQDNSIITEGTRAQNLSRQEPALESRAGPDSKRQSLLALILRAGSGSKGWHLMPG